MAEFTTFVQGNAKFDVVSIMEHLKTAGEWQGFVRLLYVQAGRPPVKGYPASRVEQILWGDRRPDGDFLAELLAALAGGARRPARASVDWDAFSESWCACGKQHDTEVAIGPRLRGRLAKHGFVVKTFDSGGPETATVTAQPCDEAEVQVHESVSELPTELVQRVGRASRPALGPVPEYAESPEQFRAVLRALKDWSGLSLRQLEQKAKASDQWLARATTADMLNRTELPRPNTLWAFTGACGLPPEQQHRWEAVRARLAKRPPHADGAVGLSTDDADRPAR